MYSGITRGLFPVVALDKKPGLLIYTVQLNPELVCNLKNGDSVAIDGVCQTVVNVEASNVTFNAIAKTLSHTTLGALECGQRVSVERSVRYGDEIGGHDMAGHIFEMGTIIDKITTLNNLCLVIQCSENCIQYIFDKGFIGLDGSSLTLHNVNQQQRTFEVYLIPETIRLSNFGNKNIGDAVNIECDSKAIVIVNTIKKYLSKA